MKEQFQEIKDIIIRFLLKESTEEEQDILKTWYQEDAVHEEFYRRVCEETNVKKQMSDLEDIDVEKAYKRNQQLLKKHSIRRIFKKTLPYAAVILLIIGLSLSWWIGQSNKEVLVSEKVFLSGSKQAKLILGDGSALQLYPDMKKKLQEGVAEIIIADNNIDYSKSLDSSGFSYNTICTPLGGEYSVILSDGTEVWLNAMSELRYPVTFQGNERRVQLKGEACFRVKQDSSRPFYVDFFDYEVKVLGTTFNIKAYKGEEQWQTTLCSGSISFSDMLREKNIRLSPGTQIICTPDSGQMLIKEVDTDLYIAWTKGVFAFDDTPLEEIFNVLQRWYKIEVFYENCAVRQEVFTGKLPRFDNLRTILNIMEKVSKVRFELKDSTLIVR